MSALAMILAAAMVVPADRPEKVSGEIAEPRQLDLRGEWEVKFVGYYDAKTVSRKQLYRIFRIKDEGGGKLRMALPNITTGELLSFRTGTYHQEKNRVVIQFHLVDKKDSAIFSDKMSKGCIILHRAESSE